MKKSVSKISALAILIAFNSAQMPAYASESEDKTGVKLSLKAPDENVVVDLTYARDWGLNMRQIKELALSLYLEATRFKPTVKDSSEISTPEKLPKVSTLDKSKLLEPRKQWIAYYLTTMEPVAQFIHGCLRSGEKGAKSGLFPKGVKKEIQPIRKNLLDVAYSLERHLDSLYDLFEEEEPTAIDLAKVARQIYMDANRFEKLRKQFYEVIRKAEEKGVTQRVSLPRPR